MISVQKRKSTCSSSSSSTPIGSAQTMAPNHCLSMSQQVICQQQRSKGNGITARKRCKTSGSHQNSASKRTSLNHILENQQHFQNQQQPQSQSQQQQQQQQQQHQMSQNEEPVWIFGLINNIEQLLTTFNASGANNGSSTNPKSAGSTPSFSAAGSPAASSPSCSSTLSSTSSSSSSSPASYASTSGCAGPVADRFVAAQQQQQQQQQPQIQQNQLPNSRAPSASIPRSSISRQIKFHEYKGPPSAKRQQVSSNKTPLSTSQQKQLTQLQLQQSAISRNVLNSSKVNEDQTTITKSTAATPQSSTPTPTIVNQRLVDSNVTLASNHIQQQQQQQQQQKQSKLSSTFNQQALTAANSQPISSATVGVSTSQAIKQQQQQQQQRQTQQPMSVSSSRELNLAVFAQPSKQLQQSSRQQEQQQQPQQQQLFMQHNQMNFKQHLARPMIQQIQNQTHTIQPQLDARQLSSDQLTSASSQCATNSLGHTFYINQSATAAAAAACLDSSGSNGDSTRSLMLTPTGNHTEVVEVEPSRHRALLGGAFAKPQHEQPIVVSTQQSYHDHQLAACLAHQQQNTLVKMETPTSDCQTSCFVKSQSTTSSVATNEAAIFPVEQQPFNMFDEEELSNYSPILNSSHQTQQMLDEELNSFGPDSEDIACEIEPSISFSSQVDDLLFSEFIDLQDVPMNVDESDWLKKFLPPCSMS